MRAIFVASAYGRSGRHLRFTTLIAALLVIDLWLWARFASGTSAAASRGEIGIALAAGSAALLAIVALWRNPLNRDVPMMATPALRQQLATHRAGHIVAGYLQDPTAVTSVDLTGPCPHGPSKVPIVTERALRSQLTCALAGLTAEEIFAGESGIDATSDLERATALGADMVGRFGMSGSLVSLATSHPKRGAFIDKVLEDARTRKELEALLRDTRRDTMRIMLENRHLIIELRDALTRHHRMTAAQVRTLMGKAEERRHTDDSVLVDLRSAGERPRPQLQPWGEGNAGSNGRP